MLRVYFLRDRRLLGKLSQCVADALKTLFRVTQKDRMARSPASSSPCLLELVTRFVTDKSFQPIDW